MWKGTVKALTILFTRLLLYWTTVECELALRVADGKGVGGNRREKGGYEASNSLLDPQAGELIVNQALKLIGKM